MGIIPELYFRFILLLRASHDAHYTAIARFLSRAIIPSCWPAGDLHMRSRTLFLASLPLFLMTMNLPAMSDDAIGLPDARVPVGVLQSVSRVMARRVKDAHIASSARSGTNLCSESAIGQPIVDQGEVGLVQSAEGHRLLRVLDEHLWFARRAGQDWLCEGGRPSVADIACFCHVVLCEEGGVSRQDYPAVRLWLDQVKRLDGFIVMSGVFPAGPAPAPR